MGEGGSKIANEVLNRGDYVLFVKTGDQKGAGTDANVSVMLFDDVGRVSDILNLDIPLRNDFERGNLDAFHLPQLVDFGNVARIEIWRDTSGLSDDWYLERITVERRKSPKGEYNFPVHRWILPSKRYTFKLFDVNLPQTEEIMFIDQRKDELDLKKKLYEYMVSSPGMPAQIKKLPTGEIFPDRAKSIAAMKAGLLLKGLNIREEKWLNLADISRMYGRYNLPMPKCLEDEYWFTDTHFGNQRLIGVNPEMIELCTSLPTNLGCNEENLLPFLEEQSLENVIQASNLFIVNLKVLEGISTREVNKQKLTLCAPIALFYLNSQNELVPIAIQLFQMQSLENPVFFPSDDEKVWTLAKMWFNNAEAQYHQAITHLGKTHFIMEGISIAVHRNLSPSHPIYKLLAPHLMYIFNVNDTIRQDITNKGGFIDSYSTTGLKGFQELVKSGLMDVWNFDTHGNLIKSLGSRGMINVSLLPDDYWSVKLSMEEVDALIQKSDVLKGVYHWRDDALMLFECIKGYILDVVKYFYDTPEKVREDYELQNFAKELVTSREIGQLNTKKDTKKCGGLGLQGLPGGGKLQKQEDLVQVLTWIIYTCTAGHASSFAMYEEYGYPPNYAICMHGKPPTNKEPECITDDTLMALLPSKAASVRVMAISKMLSDQGKVKALGDWEVQFLYDPESVRAAEKFRLQLQQCGVKIKQRNKVCRNPYPYLDPETMANSISV